MDSLRYLFLICLTFIGSDSYRILAVFHFNSRSHNIFLEGIAKGLATRGNQVDVVSHFKLKNPPKNYRTIIDLRGTRPNLMNNFTIEYASQLSEDIVHFIAGVYGNELCELMALDEMQKLIQNPPKDPPYDLVLTEAFGANCYIGLGYVFKVPVITASTCLEYSWISGPSKNPDSTAFAPNVLMDSAEISTFRERLKNTIITHFSRYKFFTITEKVQNAAMKKYLRADIPSIREVEKSVALTFVNSHYSLSGIRPRTLSFVDIAGVHIENSDENLSPDLQTWMDESIDGVVYFSLGSMVIIETFPRESLLAFYASFKKISPVRVLMKIVNIERLPPGLPSNVRTFKWIPQIAVLRHNNTRLFITHGGLIGTEEALYYGVPSIGMPIYGDQYNNIRILIKKNMAVMMDYKQITEKSLDDALNTVLHNPLYRESAKRESRLFCDRPMSATDTMNFWVGYIMRNGARALRSPAVDLYWWQVELLDVYGFLLSCFIAICFSIVLCVRYAARTLWKAFRRNHDFSEKED